MFCLITAAPTAGFSAVGARSTFSVGLKVEFIFFHLAVSQNHFRIVNPALLVFFDVRTGHQKNTRCEQPYRFF
jgi:hypothetical protein